MSFTPDNPDSPVPHTADSTFERVALDLAHHAFPALAAALRQRCERILKEWRALSLKAMPHFDRMTLEEFENTIGKILSAAADALQSQDPQQLRGLIEHASSHGHDRFIQKVDLLDYFEEERILRGVIIIELTDALKRPMEVGEAATFHAIFDIMIQQGAMALVQKQKVEAERLLISERSARAQAETANRAKDTFLAVLSHELRTPLTPVVMTIAALELNRDLPLSVRDDVKMIRRNIELEAKLIDDLLDLSRITTGKLLLRTDVLDINDLLKHACDMCRSNLRGKGITLHCDLNENASPVVGDSARLQQVFWNLLNNAAKFTPADGDIYVTTENVGENVGENVPDANPKSADPQAGSPNPKSPGVRVRVTVRDTGIGIPPENLPRIFDAFEQGNPQITRQFGGMGLGLAISRLLIEQHGGSIRAETAGPNQGSTFIVELPAASPQQIADPTAKSRASAGVNVKPLRVLVVEDHADTAEVVKKLLASAGHTVITAYTATAALALAAQHPFDLIISDLGLPDMTGYELMKQIKEKHGKGGIKGIAMSGYGTEEDIRRSEQAGFSDHMVKPVTFAQLEASIRRVMHNG